jgi:predicted NAD/FAD-binding protein
MKNSKKERICIVGAGASGMACAWNFSKHLNQVNHIDIYDTSSNCGGVATSEPIKINATNDETFINDGVQAAAPSYRNTLSMLNSINEQCEHVKVKISFGKNETAWNNQGKSQKTKLVKKLHRDIERF